jgi:multidrug efflux pump subunit AcrA (membrane-fusion protein)
MKKSQLILIAVFLVFTGSVYFVLSRNQKPESKEIKESNSTIYLPVQEVINIVRPVEITSYGQISPNSEIIVSFEVQGRLIQGSNRLKEGTKFKAGEILYKVDNEEAYYSMNARKSSLATLVLNAMPDIELEYPNEKQKWIRFMNDLHPAQILPELPKMASDRERMFITGRNILAEYYNLKSTEARLAKYMYVAPFSGTVVSLMAEPGSIVGPGVQVAKIAKTGDHEVKVPIDIEDLELFKAQPSAEFYTTRNELIGTGKILRISDVINQSTQSIDVYFSIKALAGQTIYNGTYVNVSVNEKVEKETMIIPRIAVRDNKVAILEGDKLLEKEVLIVGQKPDSVFVTGLRNGQSVVLEKPEKINPKANYKGIER